MIFDHKNGELAYVLHTEFWGQGYATEVGNLLLDFGFSTRGLHRIYATCDPDNIGSAKVLKKLGMKLEGRLRDDLWIKNRWRDSSIYGVLETEWRENNRVLHPKL